MKPGNIPHATALLLLVVAAIDGCQKPPPAPPPPKPPEVFVSTPTQQTVTDYEEYSGRLAALNTVDLRARVSGYLESVDFKDGADLPQGAPLFHIDPRPFAAALAQAEASVAQLEARFERWKRQEARMNLLVPEKVTTEQDVEVVRFQRMETEAELKAARAVTDNAKLNLDFTKISSPIAGRISRRLVDPGNLVKADDTLLATLVSLDPIYAYFDVDERTVLQVRRLISEGRIESARDTKITVHLALADEQEFTLAGTIDFVDNQLSPTTGTLRIRAEVANPTKQLAPGMFVRVQVPIGSPRPALLVREEALGSDQGQKFVYVLNDKDEVNYRRIIPGQLINGQRVVNKGLEANDRVIVSGLQRVRPGIQVNPKPAEDEANKGLAQSRAATAK